MAWLKRQYDDIKGNLKWALLGPAWTASVWAANHLLHLIPSLPQWAVSAIVLIASFGIFFVVANSSTRLIPGITTGSSQTAINPEVPRAFESMDKFYATYSSVLVRETEENIRSQSDKYKQGVERENFLINLISRLILINLFEYVWITIFRSQLRAIEAVNKHTMKIEELRPFYDGAVSGNPVFYHGYSFSSWLSYLKNWKLLIEVGDTITITLRGQEFLKYLVHTRRSADDRSN